MHIDYFSVSSGPLCNGERPVHIGEVSLLLLPESISVEVCGDKGSFTIDAAQKNARILLCISGDFSSDTTSSNAAIAAASQRIVEILEKQPHKIHPAFQLERVETIWRAPANYEGERYFYSITLRSAPITKQTIQPEDFSVLIAIAQQAVSWLIARDEEIYRIRTETEATANP